MKTYKWNKPARRPANQPVNHWTSERKRVKWNIHSCLVLKVGRTSWIIAFYCSLSLRVFLTVLRRRQTAIAVKAMGAMKCERIFPFVISWLLPRPTPTIHTNEFLNAWCLLKVSSLKSSLNDQKKQIKIEHRTRTAERRERRRIKNDLENGFQCANGLDVHCAYALQLINYSIKCNFF